MVTTILSVGQRRKIMNCPNCKTENQNGNFCSECGDKLKGTPLPTLAETIKISWDERLCGMKYCPFHQWAKVTNPLGPADSICKLQGECGNVLCCDPDYWSRNVPDLGYCNVERLPKCYKVRPLSDEFLKKHPELTKDYIGQEKNL